VRRTVTTWVTRAALAVAGFAIALLVVEAYYEWDAHWDAEGHAVVAEALAPFVETLLRD
jgi:hypothetical protein